MKKAEKIFQDTWYECLDHAKSWGKEYNPDGRAIGYGSLITEEVVCTRTLKRYHVAGSFRASGSGPMSGG